MTRDFNLRLPRAKSSQKSGWDLNSGPLGYKSSALTTWGQCLPIIIISPAKGKKMRWEKWKRRGGESQSKNKKLRLLCHLKVCFLHMLKLQKVKFYVWIERPQSVWPVNGFVWALYRQTVRRKWLDQLKNASFGKIPRNVKQLPQMIIS